MRLAIIFAILFVCGFHFDALAARSVADRIANSGASEDTEKSDGSNAQARSSNSSRTQNLSAYVGLTSTDVLTQHNDPQRTGQNQTETVLTQSNVNPTTFGRLYSLPVDGWIYAQPLSTLVTYKDPTTGNTVTHNLVFVATENDSVYAFDSDDLSTNQNPIWKTSFCQSPCRTWDPADVNAPNLWPQIGITATPVIDKTAGVIYVVAASYENELPLWKIHALSLARGKDITGSPMIIEGTVSGNGNGTYQGSIAFSPFNQLSRAGLVLNQGVLYIGFSSFDDNEPDHGWLFAYNSTTLDQLDVWMTTPDSGDGTIWQAGGAPAVDTNTGNLFFATGNGDPYYSGSVVDFSDSVMSIGLNIGTNKFNLPTNYFTPFNHQFLSDNDVDLGSGGVMILPDQSAGSFPHLLVAGGKEGRVYLLNRDSLGGLNTGAWTDTPCNPPTVVTNCVVDEMIGDIPGGTHTTGIFGLPAYFNGNIYYAANKDYLRSIPLTNGLFDWDNSTRAGDDYYIQMRGATPSISANNVSDGIVWYLNTSAYTYNWMPGTDPNTTNDGPALLYAFKADDLPSGPIFSSKLLQTGDDQAGYAVKFTVPTVANGLVFVGTQTELTVYGISDPIATSVDSIQSKWSLNVFPNPVASVLTIDYQDPSVVTAQVSISDIAGRTAVAPRETNFSISSQVQINVNSLAAGLYIVRIESAANTVTIPFVKR